MAPQYKLTYFDFPALAEPIRFLFSYGGIEFEDIRFKLEEWPAIKPKMPFGQVPILEIDGKVINQSSTAISRFVAKLVKLAGKDDIHAMEIDAMVDNINDMRLKMAQYSFEEDGTQKKKLKGPLINETLPFTLGKMDALVKNGYLVRGELSWADITFVSLLDLFNYMMKFDILEKYPNLQKVRDNVLAIPNIKKWVKTRPKSTLP